MLTLVFEKSLFSFSLLLVTLLFGCNWPYDNPAEYDTGSESAIISSDTHTDTTIENTSDVEANDKRGSNTDTDSDSDSDLDSDTDTDTDTDTDIDIDIDGYNDMVSDSNSDSVSGKDTNDHADTDSDGDSDSDDDPCGGTDVDTSNSRDTGSDIQPSTDSMRDNSANREPTCEGPIRFKEAALENLVRAEISKSHGDIYSADVAELKALVADHLGILDLTGLECLFALEALNLNKNEIVDLTPLGSLTSLTTLEIESNKVQDLSPLRHLSNLKKLSFFTNKVTGLRPIQNLPKITYLNASANLIESVPKLNMPSLDYFNLAQNPLVSFSTENKQNHLSTLIINDTRLTDLAFLRNFPALNRLDADDMGLDNESFQVIYELTSLTDIKARRNLLTNVSGISNLSSLVFLYLDGNRISSLNGLSDLSNLVYLYLNENLIEDIGPLVSNPGIGSRDIVSLFGNSLGNNCIDGVHEDIGTLESRGVTVYWDGCP